MVGQALAGGLARLGHAVAVGTRDPDATLARTRSTAWATRRSRAWHADYTDVALTTLADAPPGAERSCWLATAFAAIDMLTAAGGRQPGRRSPCSTSRTRSTSRPASPPSLFVKDTDSLAEQIQAAFPEAGW